MTNSPSHSLGLLLPAGQEVCGDSAPLNHRHLPVTRHNHVSLQSGRARRASSNFHICAGRSLIRLMAFARFHALGPAFGSHATPQAQGGSSEARLGASPPCKVHEPSLSLRPPGRPASKPPGSLPPSQGLSPSTPPAPPPTHIYVLPGLQGSPGTAFLPPGREKVANLVATPVHPSFTHPLECSFRAHRASSLSPALLPRTEMNEPVAALRERVVRIGRGCGDRLGGVAGGRGRSPGASLARTPCRHLAAGLARWSLLGLPAPREQPTVRG